MLPRLLATLLLFGSTAFAQTPWIGVELDPAPTGGARVNYVLSDSPAAKAGLRAGDVVQSVAGSAVHQPDDLVALVRAGHIGERLQLRIQRDGTERDVSLKLEARPSGNVLVGRKAPDFSPTVRSGAALPKLSSLRGQVVLIDFFATWCVPCVRAMPHIQSLHERLASRGLRVMGVSTETAEIVRSAAGRFGVEYSLVSDESEEISRRYQVRALPTMVVIDRRGMIRAVSVANIAEVDAAVDAALSEK